MSDLNDKIKTQIEFYFSDSNFRRDKYLQNLAKQDEDGFVSIEELLKFNRLAALSKDITSIAKALKDSETVVVSDDDKSLRRSIALPETDDSKQRTLYAKGFPIDDADVNIESLIKLFSDFGKVLMVKLRKNPATGLFKGGVFVEFDNVDTMIKAVKDCNQSENEDPHQKISYKYKDKLLACVMPYEDWWAAHIAKRKRRAAEKKEKTAQAEGKGAEKRKADNDTDLNDVEFVAGMVLKVDGLETDVSLESLKTTFGTFGDLKYVEWEEGNTECICRFGDAESCKKASAALEGGEFEIGDKKCSCTGKILEGDEEKKYWMRYNESTKNAAKRQKQQKQQKGGKRGGYKGGFKGKGRGGGKRERRETRDF